MTTKRLPSVRVPIFASLFLLFLPSLLCAQGVEFISNHYIKYEYQIPMRDGVQLFTVVYTPKDTSQTYPIFLVRTQSGVRPYGPDQFPKDLGPSPLFGTAGYIFVYQDIRGRWMSQGDYINMRPFNPAKKSPQDTDESSDTYDTVDWLIKNVRNHNGKVGLYGTSYRGFLAASGMIDAHPAIQCASPQAPVIDWFAGDDWHHNGAFILTHAFNYLPFVGKHRVKPDKTPYVIFDYGTPDSYEFFMRLGPLANADARYFKGTVPFWNEVMRHGTNDKFWQPKNLGPHLRNIKPAVLLVGGWFDAENLYGALEAHRQILAGTPGVNETFVMGPWIHGGWNGGMGDGASLGDVSFKTKTADYYRENIELPFFEFHLKGKGSFNFAKTVMFETGTNQWREFATWPPKETKPFVLYFQAQGSLAHDPPGDAGTEFDEYLSDPARPVPYIERIVTKMATDYPVADQRFAARRPDVLVYQTPALTEDLTLAGPMLADLHVSTTGTDSDWIVKVIDVYPDDYPDPAPNPTGVRMGGFEQLVRGDVMRGKFRESLEKPQPFTPGEPTEVKLKLNDVYHTFRSGHKIMVQVQSTWFPLVDRNPQTFVDIYSAKETDFRKATQRVYHSKTLPSRIVGQQLP